MLRAWGVEGGRLVPLAADPVSPGWAEGAAWIDLMAPTAVEQAAVETALGLALPTREDMEEIEISSRLYVEDGAAFMTATLPSDTDTDAPVSAPVTFVLAGPRLVTLRHHGPKAFDSFPPRAEKVAAGCVDGDTIFVALLEAVVDRLADILERAGRDIDRVSQTIFQRGEDDSRSSAEFRDLMKEIGRRGDLIAKLRDNLVSLQRMLGFLSQVETQRHADRETRARLKTLARDARSLTEHADFLSQKITFLLDALLGLINIEQSAIIKIVSVAALVFLPPTVIASIYGMNFEIMPELGWTLGYPFALGLMVMSAILPYLIFKARGWL